MKRLEIKNCCLCNKSAFYRVGRFGFCIDHKIKANELMKIYIDSTNYNSKINHFLKSIHYDNILSQ